MNLRMEHDSWELADLKIFSANHHSVNTFRSYRHLIIKNIINKFAD